MSKGKPAAVTTTKDQSKAPVFNLNPSNLDFTDDAELQDELGKSGGKFFDDPCNIDLEVVAADFHPNKETGSIYCKGDDTWFNVVMTLRGAGDKEIKHWIQVPTSKIKFGEKDTLAVYKKFQQFLFALGEEVTLNALGELVQKYFSDPGAGLVGVKVNVDLGYEGPYIGRLPDSEDFAIMVGNKPVSEDGKPLRFPDKQSAAQVAKGRGIQTSFVKITKFTAGKTAAKPAKGKLKAAKLADKKTDDEW